MRWDRAPPARGGVLHLRHVEVVVATRGRQRVQHLRFTNTLTFLPENYFKTTFERGPRGGAASALHAQVYSEDEALEASSNITEQHNGYA